MFRLAADVQVYLHREAIDFRIGINGLAILVEQAMHLDPFGRAVFGFCNRRRDRIRLLFYDRSGFWLMMKRLEADRFAWPRGQQQAVVRLSSEQLHWLLEGIDIEAVQTASGAAVSQRRLTLKDTASANRFVLDKVGGFRFKDTINRAATTEELTSLIAAHAAEIAALKAENETLAQRVIHLEEQLRLERLHRYAPRSEKLKDRILRTKPSRPPPKARKPMMSRRLALPIRGWRMQSSRSRRNAAAGRCLTVCRASASSMTCPRSKRSARVAATECTGWAKLSASSCISR